MNILRVFSDLVFPRRCEGCGGPADRPDRHLCSDCLNRVPFLPTEGCCRVCGRSVAGLDAEFLCEDCRRPPRPDYDRAAAAVRFEGRARQMLLDFKFNRHIWLRDDFADWMLAAAGARFDLAAVDLVVPVPTTFLHRWNRGYNQSAYLAREIARRIGRRFMARALKRVGNPRRQSALDERERRENAAGTVAVAKAPWVRGRTVLVVDDVMTTGATLSACAKAMKAAGASRVWCVSLARSVRD